MSTNYQQLVDKVDAFFDRVRARQGDQMQCGPGCSRCCLLGLTVTSVEADAIRRALAALDDETRAGQRARVADAASWSCPALAPDGRCTIYAARPLVCRSHGLPVRLAAPGYLPVVQACELNFRTHGPAAVPDDQVLDQTTLSTLLAAVDGAFTREHGLPAGVRIALADLLDGS